MDAPKLHLTGYFSAARCLVRRSTRRAASSFNPGRGVCRRHGLVAMLLVTDQSSVVDAFGGVTVGVISSFWTGSAGSGGSTGAAMAPAGEALPRRLRGHGRRVMVRPRPTTLAPATDAGEGRALSGERPSQDGSASADESSSFNTATLDRDQRQVAARRPSRGGDTWHNGKRQQLGVVDRDRALRTERGRNRVGQSITRKSPPSNPIASVEELNSRQVDPSLVRQSVLHYLANPKQLTCMEFAGLGMASSRHGDIHLTVEVLEKARLAGITADVRFMTNMVNAAAQTSRWVMATQLMQLMRTYGVPPNDITYTCILSQLSKAKQHHIAAELIRTEGLQGKLFAYNALISGCAANRDYQRAMEYFDDMRKMGVEPNEMTFSSLIATTRDGSPESSQRGLAAIRMMEEVGLRPNTYCMNSLMAVHVHARQPNTALEIFEEMKRDGIPRDVVSYNTAISACDKLGDPEAAVRLLRQAREDNVEPDVTSYNTVISALGHSSLWQEATQIFEEMHEAGVVPSLISYNSLIAGCVRAEAPNEALSVFNRMKERRIKRDQYSFAGALHASMHLRDYELALDLLDEMVDMGMPANAEGYATAIRTCARCSKSDEAMYLYANQLRMTVLPNKVTFKALMEAFADAKDAERAAWVLDEMREMLVPIQYVHLMDVLYACTDQCHVALDVLRINQELGLNTVAAMYALALEVCITAGDYAASTTVMDMMAHVGLHPEPEQEKRMHQCCADPTWSSNRKRPRAVKGDEDEEGKGESGGVGADSWRGRGKDEEDEEDRAGWRER